jgi:hypothetical protein
MPEQNSGSEDAAAAASTKPWTELSNSGEAFDAPINTSPAPLLQALSAADLARRRRLVATIGAPLSLLPINSNRTREKRSQMTFTISNAKVIRKNSLVGSFDLEMPSGLIVRGAMLFEKNGARWVNFPSKEYQKQDGSKGYFPLLEFASREISDKFRDKVLPLANEAFKLLEPAPQPTKFERTRGHWSGPNDGPNDDIAF